ncbi:MAG: circadian clock protein KaiB [Candidatus Omnitrophota bacterium]|jgi:circadian clock protein KaiB
MAGKNKYILKLYVAGRTPNSIRAIQNLNKIFSDEFKDMLELKIIDVLENRQLAEDENILATPTLARVLPEPVKRVIGDFSNKEKVLLGLDLL